jgi:NADH-quinone oxidoreductase subunit J
LGFETVAFYVFAALAVGCSLLVVGQRNPVYSVLMLIASFGALAGLYVLLDAPFTAVTQIIVYAGAIMVLFLFVVMLLNVPREDAAEYDRSHPLNRPGERRFGALLAVALVVELGWAVWHASVRQAGALADVAPGTVASVREIGRVLYRDYAFPFEVTSILILVAMVGAIILARPRQQESR